MNILKFVEYIFIMIKKYLSENIRTSLENIDVSNACEIRIRLGKPIYIIFSDREEMCDYLPDKRDISETFSRMCRYSPFAYIESIKRGFITVEGGCRVGLCGTVVEGNNLKDITSINIRLAKDFKGCAELICRLTKANVLIASSPAMGKTTMLRDFIRIRSNEGFNVGVADERGEISGEGFDLGSRTDVIIGGNKACSMSMILRSMSPHIVAVDELGSDEDIKAAFEIIHCGVNLVATIHCKNMSEIKYRLGKLYDVFDYIVFLGAVGKVSKIYKGDVIIWQ